VVVKKRVYWLDCRVGRPVKKQKDLLAAGKRSLIGALYEKFILHFGRNKCLVRPSPKKWAEKGSVPD
jgi:hypothetical protein